MSSAQRPGAIRQEATPGRTSLCSGKDFQLQAVDGVSLAATFHGSHSHAPLVLIAPATGVRRAYYHAFTNYLTTRGFNVLTWDWRGMGDSRPDSLKGFTASLRDRGEWDPEGAIHRAGRVSPSAPLIAIGHSCRRIDRPLQLLTCCQARRQRPVCHHKRSRRASGLTLNGPA